MSNSGFCIIPNEGAGADVIHKFQSSIAALLWNNIALYLVVTSHANSFNYLSA